MREPDEKEICKKLLGRKLRAANLPPIASGIYALFLEKHDKLPMLSSRADGLLYIGMTTDDSGARNHFEVASSGFSSPRRSLGALLKGDLQLTAIPRSNGATRTNWTNYRFSDEGEARLTRWMTKHLRANHVPIAAGKTTIEHIEKHLIRDLTPALNLRGVPKSANRHKIEEMRRLCREEAKSGTFR